MPGTLDTPWGRLRTGTTRRYVIVVGTVHGKPSIAKRSDNLATLRNLTHRYYRGQGNPVIIDTCTKEIVK